MIKILFFFLPVFAFPQVLITSSAESNAEAPHPSAMLETRASDKGIALEPVLLQSKTDQTTILNPTEGMVALNFSTQPTFPSIPSTKPTVVVWNGSEWLFGYKEDDSLLSLDFIRNYSIDNVSNGVATVVSFSSFPASDPAAVEFEVLNETGPTAWKTLISTENSGNTKPVFRFTNLQASQRMIIDAEGIVSVNSNADYASRFTYGYEVGIFIKSPAVNSSFKLVSAQKFLVPAITGLCHFHKYNMLAIVDDNTFFANAPAGSAYNVRLAVRPLTRSSSSNFTNMAFGNAASGCSNINTDTARSYINILTIEKKNQ